MSSTQHISIPNLSECNFNSGYLRLDILWIYFHISSADQVVANARKDVIAVL